MKQQAGTLENRCPGGARRQRGFTLFELFITIAIVSILAAVAIPSYRTTVLNNARSSAVLELLGAIRTARSEAIKRGTEVKVCPSADRTNCQNGTSADWRVGVVAFIDEDDNDTVGSGEQVIVATGPLPESVGIFGNRQSLRLRPFNQRSTNGTLSVCDERGQQYGRAIIINVSGRAHVADNEESNVSWNCPN